MVELSARSGRFNEGRLTVLRRLRSIRCITRPSDRRRIQPVIATPHVSSNARCSPKRFGRSFPSERFAGSVVECRSKGSELPGSLAYQVVLPALPDFFARYPDVQVELNIGNRSVDLIAENLDCMSRLGPAQRFTDCEACRHVAVDYLRIACVSRAAWYASVPR